MGRNASIKNVHLYSMVFISIFKCEALVFLSSMKKEALCASVL